MIFPRMLSKGDSIGVTAPSFGVTDPTDVSRFENAVKKLEERGHHVILTPDVFTADETGRSAPADQRVRELNTLLDNPEVRYIVSAKGGDYQFEMIPLMDWELLKKDPKWIQGYSDNTTLLFKITVEHDVATIYSGNFGDYGMEPWHDSILGNIELIEGKVLVQESFSFHEVGFVDRITGLEGIRDEEPTVWRCDRGDCSFKGRLIGGCMDVLEWFHANNTADPTGFVSRYSNEGIVWYMETYDMDSQRIVAMLEGMKADGWFEDVTGFIFGRPLFYQGPDYMETICNVLSDFDVPKVFDADVGHKAPRMTFINGANAEFVIRDGCCVMTMELG